MIRIIRVDNVKIKEEVIITNSFEETQKLGEGFVSRSEILLRRTKSPIIIALYGDLGTGKTTFVQGLAKGLGIKKRIISPTFVIIRNYELGIMNPRPRQAKRGGHELKIKNFYHVDLYRIENRSIEGLGIEEIINDSQNIVAIEWAEKMENLLPKERINIYFDYLENDKRKIRIEDMT